MNSEWAGRIAAAEQHSKSEEMKKSRVILKVSLA